MGTARLASGETLVRQESHADQKCGDDSHRAPVIGEIVVASHGGDFAAK